MPPHALPDLRAQDLQVLTQRPAGAPGRAAPAAGWAALGPEAIPSEALTSEAQRAAPAAPSHTGSGTSAGETPEDWM